VETLAALAASGTQLDRAQRYRRVLSTFDQQDLKTGFTVRWDERDLQLVPVEGLAVHIDTADVAISVPLSQGAYEGHLIDFFKDHVREGMHVVDAGANIGLYSLLAAKLVGPAGRVWSFEPNSENARLLLASAVLNRLENVTLHPVALGAERGYTFFTSAVGSNGGVLGQAGRNLTHPSCKIVPTARLDDFGIARVDLLKMDVEGAEGLLLQGAGELLARCRPLVTTEFSNEMLTRISGMSGAAFLGLFRGRGYSVAMLDRSTHRVVPVSDTDAFAAEFEGTGRIEDLVLTPPHPSARQ
jgi:FkbM family methyltransferase